MDLRNVLVSQTGQAFLENALYIIAVVFVLAGASFVLIKNGIKPKCEDLGTALQKLEIP